jgi:hypothetical protein
MEPPVYRDGPGILERLVKVLPETLDCLLLRPVQVQRCTNGVQVLRQNDILKGIFPPKVDFIKKLLDSNRSVISTMIHNDEPEVAGQKPKIF